MAVEGVRATVQRCDRTTYDVRQYNMVALAE